MLERAAAAGQPLRADRRRRAEVAQTRRIAHQLGHLDLLGVVSARSEDGRRVLLSPTVARPWATSADDVVTLDLDGRLLAGHYPPPMEAPLHLAVYRRRRDVGALIVGSPVHTAALGIVRRDALPLTHTNAALAHAGAAFHVADGLVRTPARAEAAALALGLRSVLQPVGTGVLVTADRPIEALRRLDAYEYLAGMTIAVEQLGGAQRVVTPDEANAIAAERPFERVPSRDPHRYLRSLDRRLVRRTQGARWARSDDAVAETRRRVAIAGRTLAAERTLVAYFEHVSHRIPGRDDWFVMSPAMAFDRMRPEDMGVVAMHGDCAAVDGPYPPAPFRWFHRDLFAARPDVDAIVHTHEFHGRAHALAGVVPRAVFRTGAEEARAYPTYPVPTLVFTPEHRRGVLETLDSGDTVHVIAHGTDFVADRLETAVVRAIRRERLCRLDALARGLGEVHPLSREAIADLVAWGPGVDAWWGFYSSMAIPAAGEANDATR